MKASIITIGVVMTLLGILFGVMSNPSVQYKLGLHYYEKQDYEIAAGWYLKAGMDGNILAQKAMASMVINLEANPEDFIDKSFYISRWVYVHEPNVILIDEIKKGVARNDSLFFIGYGFCHYFGLEFKEDKVVGCAWIRATEILCKNEREVRFAGIYIKSAELEMTPQEIAESKVLAEEIVAKIKANQSKEAVGQ